ncbi:MAG TPA: pyridoxamine 5'-phosphate oxidase [Candidatus Krumholzibacteria bacterium]|nr:pyridoxamine 5'-phosphate oxidase [Candidatus Krumholzibacteria bacterium]
MIHLKEIIDRFDDALARATASGMIEPTAMALATVGDTGRPSSRVVLLKHADEHGFVFYTNTRSRKGRELAHHPWAALCFWWAAIGEQVHIEGRVKPVTPEEADEYFASRPRGSQIGAWGSHQSDVIASRQVLLDRVAEVEARYAGQAVPRPAHWSGYRLIPDRFEFWYARENRLHERIEFRFENAHWVERTLSP